MPDKKTAETKVEVTAAAPAEEKKTAAKKPAEKKATAAKKPAEKKAAAAKKPAEKKAAAKKPAEKKATAAKKPAAKKTAAAAVDSKVVIQAMGSEVNTAELIAKATKASGAKTVKKVDVYVRPEVNKVYYVVNGDILGDFDLF